MINIWIVLLALVGLGISYYIYHGKKPENAMVCHIGAGKKTCDQVVTSKYNKMFGVPNEILGMIYYIITAVFAVAFLLGYPTIFSISIPFILLIMIIGGFTFSVYLTYIQGAVLKMWCEYCIASAVVNLLILIIELF